MAQHWLVVRVLCVLCHDVQKGQRRQRVAQLVVCIDDKELIVPSTAGMSTKQTQRNAPPTHHTRYNQANYAPTNTTHNIDSCNAATELHTAQLMKANGATLHNAPN